MKLRIPPGILTKTLPKPKETEVEADSEPDSEPEATTNAPSQQTNHSRPKTTAYAYVSESEEGTSEDQSSESGLNEDQNQNLNGKRRSYKRRRYRANVRARINKERTTVEWLSYVGAYDAHRNAHRKLVDNWGEYLQSVMWCSPQPIDISQIELEEKPKLSRTVRRRQNKEAAQQQKEVDLKEKSLTEQDPTDLHPTPERFKSYNTGERKVAYTKAQRKPTREVAVSMMAHQLWSKRST